MKYKTLAHMAMFCYELSPAGTRAAEGEGGWKLKVAGAKLYWGQHKS